MLGMFKAALGGGTEKISPEQARTLAKDGALIIDVREPAELKSSGKIKGAINIPAGSISTAANLSSPHHDTRLNKDRVIIVYCASGMRSGSAGATLKAMGYEKVYNLGTLSAWAAAGGPVEQA